MTTRQHPLTSRLLTACGSALLALGLLAPLQTIEASGGEAASEAQPAAKSEAASRIVSIGGGITETIFALGAESKLVGVDTSSVYPVEALALPKCGYQRSLAAEGVASLSPDLIILGGIAGPASAIEQMRKLGLRLVQLEDDFSLEATKGRIIEVAKLVGEEEKAAAIVSGIDAKLAELEALPKPEKRPRVLFLLSIHGGRTTAAGLETAADAMIKLAGAENAAVDFASYKQVSAESIAAMAPDVVLTTSRSVAQFAEHGGMEKAVPGINLTPAGKNQRVIVMDDLLLLGFGPRIGDALLELAQQLYPAASGGDSAAASVAP